MFHGIMIGRLVQVYPAVSWQRCLSGDENSDSFAASLVMTGHLRNTFWGHVLACRYIQYARKLREFLNLIYVLGQSYIFSREKCFQFHFWTFGTPKCAFCPSLKTVGPWFHQELSLSPPPRSSLYHYYSQTSYIPCLNLWKTRWTIMFLISTK